MTDCPPLSKKMALKVLSKEGRLIVAELGEVVTKLKEVFSEGLDIPNKECEEWEVGEVALYLGKARCRVVGINGDVVEINLYDSALKTFCHPEELQPLPQALLEVPPTVVLVELKSNTELVEVGQMLEGVLVKNPTSELLQLDLA